MNRFLTAFVTLVIFALGGCGEEQGKHRVAIRNLLPP